MHRAQKKGTTYTYRSHGTKKYARKSEKAYEKGDKEKGDKYKTYAKRSAELDRRMQESGTKKNAPKTIAKTLFTNSRTYEATKAYFNEGARSDIGKIAAKGAGILNSYMTGPIGATPIRMLYVRGYDRKKMLGEG